MVTLDGPFQFYTECKANYEAKFPTPVFPWYWGKSEISQHTAVERCSVEVDSETEISTKGGRIGSHNLNAAESYDVFHVGFLLHFHIYGLPLNLFNTPNSAGANGHVQRVVTTIEDTFRGPRNGEWEDASYFQKSANDPETSMWEFCLDVRLWVPVKYVQPTLDEALIGAVEIEGDMNV